MNKVVNWFIPDAALHGRTERELARTFVFTHLFGPLIAQPMSIYLYWVSPQIDLPLVVMALAIGSFWTLPLLLKLTGSITLAASASFQLLVASSLFGTYHYGGFSSPFLPWLIVSLMLGLFYLSKHTNAALTVFSANLAIFLVVAWTQGIPDRIPIDELRVVSWLSIVAAAIYMTWMALYYSRIIGLRTELQMEIEGQRMTAAELERARAVAEETSRARDRFFSKMSHELRTPLNAIIGYSDILLEDCEGGGPETAQRVADITRINAAGRHLLSLVSDVLDVEKIERDVLDIDVTNFTLGEVTDEVVATAGTMVEKNSNTFVVLCSDRAAGLQTDRTKLRQILINLLSNAGKFTEGGTVRIELAVVDKPHDAQLVASVADTGIGIAPDALKRLFNEYEQADPSIFNRYGGTGIGLALSRKLAVLLGGDMTVRSKPGQGARFTLTIPAHLPLGAAPDDDPDADAPVRRQPLAVAG